MTAAEFKVYFNRLRFLHTALFAGALTFGAVVYYATGPKEINDELGQLFKYIVPGLFIGVILISLSILNIKLKEIRAMDNVPYQLAAYQGINIIRWGLAEGTTLFAVVAYLLSGYDSLMILALLGMAYLFFQRPNLDRLVEELDLNEAEQRELGI